MAISAPFGKALRPGGPRAGSPRRPRPSPVAEAVRTRPGVLRRYPPRDLWAVAAALAGPLAASDVLLPLRAGWSNTNAALLLVVVVVAVAAAGNGLAGALAATGAAVYGSLRRHPPRLESDGRVAGAEGTWDAGHAGLPAERELRVSATASTTGGS
jgi:hypothetical protein